LTHVQDGTRQVYLLDPLQRTRARETTKYGTTAEEIYHYADDSDEPAWTRGTFWTRFVSGISGDLVSDPVRRRRQDLAALHGDTVAEASLDPHARASTTTFEATDFGVPRAPASRRYGWLGAKQRSTELPSGVSQMGQRAYLPTLGRFLQPIPSKAAAPTTTITHSKTRSTSRTSMASARSALSLGQH
jgi:hypothetical protein